MDFSKIFINNEWVESTTDDWLQVENPATEEIIARVPASGEDEVNWAVQAAKAALPAWAAAPLAQRRAMMEKFLTVFQQQEDELVDVITQELGSPRSFTRASQVRYQYVRTRSYIDLSNDVKLVEKMPASTVYREPVGVIACLTPWNYPLGQVIQKVVPAMLMGNTIVLKPSQNTPLSAYYLAEAFLRAGFPKGVFNLLPGRGAQVGDLLAEHPDVDMLSFTGSTAGGVKVAQRGLEQVKRVSLELGGKSPYVILPGCADYTEPLHLCFNSIFLNSGQTCTAFSRLLVPEAEQEAVLAAIEKILPEYTVGDPQDEKIKLGPVASQRQYDKIVSYLLKGQEEGAKLCFGQVPQKNGKGYYIRPAVFTNVTPDMSIVQDEIFGPVLCIQTYKSLEEAIHIANNTRYGLNAGVYGEKQAAIAVARQIQAGNVYINDGPRDTAAPFGGYKASGIGREGGVYGMLEFTQQKALFDTGK